MKKVIIVGGGIAGLSAGVYARQSGFDTIILEMHSIPGGNSTSWRRKGYLFEGGMHWLVGSGPRTPLHPLWLEVGALQENNPVYNRDPFLTYMDDGRQICLYRNPEKLRSHLTEISPEDKKAIDRLVQDIKIFGRMSMPVTDIKGVHVRHKTAPPMAMLLAMPSVLPRMNQLNHISAEEYISRFRHPGIRTVLGLVVGKPEFSATSIIFTLAGLAVNDCGYPKGGSLQMAQNMADTFTGLGGVIEYNSRVEKVIVDNGRAVGVMVNGKHLTADAVIVAADTLAAIDRLFDAPLHEPWMDEMRRDITPLNCTFISLGIRADLSDMPENVVTPLKKPIEFGGQSQHTFSFNQYARFQGYAPEGCTAVTCVFTMNDDYGFWKTAKENGTYIEQKQKLAAVFTKALAQAVPQTTGKVEVWDVATPLTYERYCGTYKGSWMSVLKPGCKRLNYPCKPASISNLYFAGQRMNIPGGLPVALTTGRAAVQYLCKDNDIVFQQNL